MVSSVRYCVDPTKHLTLFPLWTLWLRNNVKLFPISLPMDKKVIIPLAVRELCLVGTCHVSFVWPRDSLCCVMVRSCVQTKCFLAGYIVVIHPEAQAERAASGAQRLMDGIFINLAPLKHRKQSWLFANLPSIPLHESWHWAKTPAVQG